MGKKDELLGMSYGTASNQLRKALLFSLAQKLGYDVCFRCKDKIETMADLSIEHKEPWQSALDPVKAFFDLDNIAFSHLSCNCGAASHPPSKFSLEEREARKAETTARSKARPEYKARQKEYGLSWKRQARSDPEFRERERKQQRDWYNKVSLRKGSAPRCQRGSGIS